MRMREEVLFTGRCKQRTRADSLAVQLSYADSLVQVSEVRTVVSDVQWHLVMHPLPPDTTHLDYPARGGILLLIRR